MGKELKVEVNDGGGVGRCGGEHGCSAREAKGAFVDCDDRGAAGGGRCVLEHQLAIECTSSPCDALVRVEGCRLVGPI